MRTKILIIIGALLIIAIGIMLYLVRGTSAPATGGNTETTLPTASSTVQSTGTIPLTGTTDTTSSGGATGTVTVSGANGNGITVQDFMDASSTTEDPSNPGLYHLGMPPSASSSVPYDITYESATQYFNISLLAEPIGQTRSAMENYLMAKLGITQSAMCQLNYTVSVPYSVNSFYSDESLGFSFCPGATELPD